MPSSQTPPAGGTALDPTAVRPDIDDARIIRVTPAEVRATLARLKAEGFAMLLDIGGADYPGREPRFDVVYHLIVLSGAARTLAAVGRPERVRVLCGVPES
ncbi:MAG TPA: NADH-quinone oxidoreductase subunit C, partial [Candidatus Lustribacter sp.]